MQPALYQLSYFPNGGKKRKGCCRYLLVAKVGLEPTLPLGNQILSLARLPVSPLGQNLLSQRWRDSNSQGPFQVTVLETAAIPLCDTPIVARNGFEPLIHESESCVLPLHQRAISHDTVASPFLSGSTDTVCRILPVASILLYKVWTHQTIAGYSILQIGQRHVPKNKAISLCFIPMLSAMLLCKIDLLKVSLKCSGPKGDRTLLTDLAKIHRLQGTCKPIMFSPAAEV